MSKIGYALLCILPAVTCWLCSFPVISFVPPGNEEYDEFAISDPPSFGVTTSSSNWYDKLPACPCEIAIPQEGETPPQLNLGEGWSLTANKLDEKLINFHPGATWEIRWTSSNVEIVPGQQCTYDINGLLITEGIVAGTPDRWGFSDKSSNSDYIGHTFFDVLPYLPGFIAYQFGREDELNWYLEGWPPNNGNNCASCNTLEDGSCNSVESSQSSIGNSASRTPWLVLGWFVLVSIVVLILLRSILKVVWSIFKLTKQTLF
ncbi:hypothetical protein [Candidatus Leptofilum sp.]|uniref:hypothetical protein n=1 Tax=Candidatus Leptofilum sp. TaxID=3241576 RepID=UPI003B5A5258